MVPNFFAFGEFLGAREPCGGPLGIFKVVQSGAQNEQETITYTVKREKVKSYRVLLDFTFNLVGKNKGVRVIFENF